MFFNLAGFVVAQTGVFPSLLCLVSMVLLFLLHCFSFLAYVDMGAGVLRVTPELQPAGGRGAAEAKGNIRQHL